MMIFKQYGEQRTGTNYLKRLLEVNFSSIEVFSSILGWKHGLYELNSSYVSRADNHLDWISKKEKDGKIYSVDNYPLKYSKDFLLEAASKLQYIVSYKPILPWVVSYKKFRRPKADWKDVDVNAWCMRYIANYKNWISSLTNPIFINHDTLCSDASKIKLLCYFEQTFKINKIKTDFLLEENIIKPSTDHGLLISDKKFDINYYSNKEYFNNLPDFIIQQVSKYDDSFIRELCL